MDAHTLCPSNASFGVPRSALQNKFLLEKLKSHGGFSQSSRLWVDFNSISVPVSENLGILELFSYFHTNYFHDINTDKEI